MKKLKNVEKYILMKNYKYYKNRYNISYIFKYNLYFLYI